MVFFIFQAVVRLNHRVTQQVMTETTKSWRVKGETHGIPHGSGHTVPEGTSPAKVDELRAAEAV